ncbi:MAG: ATP-binding protein [Deltaproteobacteria bacterium]|nr:ATP-binding protein [Deltaproteobacteria bacterium]
MILICAVFVLLILITGLMDMRRVDRSLTDFMETRGLDIAEKIEKETQINYTTIIQMLRGEHVSDAIIPFTEETFHTQESLINALVGHLRRIDQNWGSAGQASKGEGQDAAEEKLWLLAILNDRGKVIHATRPLDAGLLARVSTVIKGKQDIMIDLFGRPSERQDRPRLVALRRAGGNGTIIGAFDDEGIRYWGLRVAVQRAIEETVSMQGILYVAVTDESGGILGSLGDLPESKLEKDSLLQDLLDSKISSASRKSTLKGRNLLEVFSPVYLETTRIGFARVGLESDRADMILQRNRELLYISMALVMLIGLFSLWFLYMNQNRHLARIEEMRKQLEQFERLSALGQLAAGVAHEIRNPLNAISLASQRLQREFLPEKGKEEEFQQLAGVIRDEIRRLNEIIEDFLSFFRSRRLEFRDYSVRDVLFKLVSLIEEEAKTKGVSIKLQSIDSVNPVPMDVDKLQQAFLNIIKNAMESIPGEGAISIAVEPSGSDWISIKFTDTGSGLTPEEIERIFNPEYTTKEKGLGLGLPIAHEIVRGHGGRILVQSTPGSGTTFDVRLPAGEKSA